MASSRSFTRRRQLVLEPLESRIMLNVTNPFSTPVFTAVAGQPHIVAGTVNTTDSYDADGNGFSDVVIYYDSGGTPAATSHVSIMLGQSGGHYTEQSIETISQSAKIVDAQLADFNSDNKPDVIVQWEAYTGSTATQGHIDVFKNNGNGTFTQEGSDILVAVGSGLHVLDVNGDSKQDLFVTNPTDDGVSVYLGNGDCTFQTPVTTNFGSGKTIANYDTDLNGDKVVDIILNYMTGTPIPTNSTLDVHLGHSDGSFDVAADWTDPATDSFFQTVANFSGAQYPDILAYHRDVLNPLASADVVVFKNNGNGTFTQSWSTTLDNGYVGAALPLDLDLDGNLDLVLTDGVPTLGSSRTVYVEKGAGDGTFTQTQTITINDLLLAEPFDVDHDGYRDLVANIWATDISGNPTDWGTQIFFSNHDCTFQATPVTVAPAAAPSAEASAEFDLNSDHMLDVVFENNPKDSGTGLYTADQVSVFMNNGGRSFGSEKDTDFGANTTVNYVLLDLNGDGNADAIPNYNVDAQDTATGFTFWQGNGDGTFTSADSPTLFPSGGHAQAGAIPISFEAGGANIDLLYLGTSPTGLYVSLNSTGAPVDHTPPTVDLSDPANGGSIVVSNLNSRGYIDVTFADTGGSGLNTSTITDSGQEFTLSGAAASGVTVNGAPALVSGTTYRYSFTGSFGTGTVSVNFVAGSFADGAGNPNAASTEGFTTTAPPDTTPPTVDLNDPANGGSIVASDLNARGYIDVAFADTGGSGLDPSTITDSGQEFTLGGAAASGVTVDGAPTLVSGTASTYRYAFTGAFTAGHVDVNFIAGSFADNAANLNSAATEGFDVVASAALVPISQQTNPDGNVHVSVYDVIDPANVDASKIKVTWGKNDSIASIALSGTQTMEGLGLVISGATSVGAISDTRTDPGTVAFIASDSGITSLTLKSGMDGYNLNGLSLGGLTFSADIDGDGSTSDSTALYSTGAVPSIALGGTASGDFWIGGEDPKTLLSNKSFTVKNGSLEGDLVTIGGEGAVALAGDFDSTMNIGGSLASLTIKGGSFSGTLDAGGPVGAITISSLKVGGTPVGGGVTSGASIGITGADPKTNVSLKSFSASGAITGLDMTLTGGLGTLKSAGWSGGSLNAASSGAIILSGDFASQMNLTGPLTSLTVKGGDFGGSLAAAGPVGAITISSLKVGGTPVGGGVTSGASIGITGADPKTNVSLKSFSASGAITGLDMTLTGGLGTLKSAGWSGGSLNAASSGAITLSGDFASQMNLSGPLTSLTIKGGDFGESCRRRAGRRDYDLLTEGRRHAGGRRRDEWRLDRHHRSGPEDERLAEILLGERGDYGAGHDAHRRPRHAQERWVERRLAQRGLVRRDHPERGLRVTDEPYRPIDLPDGQGRGLRRIAHEPGARGDDFDLLAEDRRHHGRRQYPVRRGVQFQRRRPEDEPQPQEPDGDWDCRRSEPCVLVRARLDHHGLLDRRRRNGAVPQ